MGGTEKLVRAIRENDDQLTEAVVRLSRSRRIFAPLALCVGAFAMLLEGIRLLLSNWRLLLVQIVPALWIWLAMFDLKIHVLHGRSFHTLEGPILIPIAIAIIAITIVAVFFNATFAYSIVGPQPPRIRVAAASARARMHPILVSGVVIGAALAFATTVAPRWGKPWFTLTLGVVVAVMMISYVAVPSRLIGVKPAASRRDKLTASVISGALSTTVCTPPYLLGRLGLLMLGSKPLVVPGILVLIVGVTLQAGTTASVRAIKLGASLTAGRQPDDDDDGPVADARPEAEAGTAPQPGADAAPQPEAGNGPNPDAGPGRGAEPGAEGSPLPSTSTTQ